MEFTKSIIERYIENFDEFQFYERIINKIEKNIENYPDISIESCKTLVEGISKTIILTLNKTCSPKEIKSGKVVKLYKKAVGQLAIIDSFEADFLLSIENSVTSLSKIRNERGEISHGHAVPKEIFSDSSFSRMIVRLTDAICSYLLSHFYIAKTSIPLDTLEYDLLSDFNIYLDDQFPDFPILKKSYSLLLFQNDYDSYFQQYQDYLIMKDDEVTEKKEDEHLSTNHEVEHLSKKENFNLLNISDEDFVWNDTHIRIIKLFCEIDKLNEPIVIELFDTYFFSVKQPTREEIANAMINKPPLKIRKYIIEQIIQDFLYTKDYLKKLT